MFFARRRQLAGPTINNKQRSKPAPPGDF